MLIEKKEDSQREFKAPIPSIDWEITDFCNFKCEYCCQGQYNPKKIRHGHADDATIGAVLKTIDSLPGIWQVKLLGGEALIHPKFFDICGKLAESKHLIKITTNFFAPRHMIERLVSVCGSKLVSMAISLHPSQVNIDDFIEKIIWFKSIKNPSTYLLVTCVVTKDNYQRLRKVKETFKEKGINFGYHALQENGKFAAYPEEIENEIKGDFLVHTEAIRGKSFFGTRCHSGQFFLVIKPNGDVFRCHDFQLGGYLGNIAKGTFRRFSEAMPCLSKKCLCTAMPARNLIRFNDRESPLNLGYLIYKTLMKDREFSKKAFRKVATISKSGLNALIKRNSKSSNVSLILIQKNNKTS